jgi:hypothetical protein
MLNFVAGSSSTPVAAPFNFAPLVTVRCSPESYLYWRTQVVNILRSHLLHGFIDGSFPCPSDVIDNPKAADDATVAKQLYNPAFTAWHQQDAAILSAIMSTSTKLVQGMALFCSTMHDAWTTLASSFASVSSSRYMQLRRQLSEVKKLDSSATTYFNKVKNMSDTLTSIWQPLRQEEFISYLLAGLDDDYDALVDRVGARTTPIPIRDLFAQLLSTEQCIEARKASPHGGAGKYSANASTYGNHGGGGKPNNYRAGGRGGRMFLTMGIQIQTILFAKIWL